MAVVLPFLGLSRHRKGRGQAAFLQSLQAARLVGVNKPGDVVAGTMLEEIAGWLKNPSGNPMSDF
jgi:hypothetical protein